MLTVKIMDFGIAKSVSDEENSVTTTTGADWGSRAYMSPSAKEGELDTRNDLWAVGITMLECALNRVPKKLATTATVPIEEMRERDYTEPFIRVVAKALNKDIEKGFQSAGEMLAKVRELTKKKTGQT